MMYSRPDLLRPLLLALLLLAGITRADAQEPLKPFVLAAVIDGRPLAEVANETREKLLGAGFEVIGEYSPYDDARILAITGKGLRELAKRSRRGGYGAVLRVSLTRNNERIELAYTNPRYWTNAYRMKAEVDSIATSLETALGFERAFGSGDLTLSARDLREYHYTFMMEYFDDPSQLSYYDSHQQAVARLRENLAAGIAAGELVYELELGTDVEQKQMTLFGVGLRGSDADDCSSDGYIMGKIDRDTPRHTAHLPYEILVYGNQVEALYGRFRIAISWPHLPMVASDTGATFFSIMCAPGAIEDALIAIAGGERATPGSQK